MSVSKIVAAAASGVGGDPLDIDDVFSTFLYTGNSPNRTTTQNINNGIDLDGEGGLVWIKRRDGTSHHALVDTARGGTKEILSNSTAPQNTADSSQNIAFNTDGFTITGDYLYTATTNTSGDNYASWTFRKAPKFFTCFTYTGNAVAGRTVSHDLGSVPGCIFVKKLTGSSRDWAVYHRGVDSSSPEQYHLVLQTTAARSNVERWNYTAPTSTEFSVGTSNRVNGAGDTYIAYLFAHNNNDGDFGPDSDQDIIKCGSYTGNTSTRPSIDLGFEPQFLMIKRTDSADNWYMLDTMRGIVTSAGNDTYLYANTSGAEATVSEVLKVTATGFELEDDFGGWNASGGTYVYIAIRRGPLAVPEDATKVFAMDTLGATTPNPPSYNAGFPVDLGIMKSKTSGTDFWRVGARLTGEKRLRTDSTAAEATDTQHKFDYQDGWYDAGSYVDSQYHSWMWKRAPGYFDSICFTGNGTAGRTVSHNLGVAPEMVWVKNRSDAANWAAWHSGLSSVNSYLELNSDDEEKTSTEYGRINGVSATTITLGVAGQSSTANTNSNNNTYIAYLFASCPGVSKVGSFTQGSSSQTIDCGFTSGARFVLIKRTDGVNNWIVFDSVRGIVSGNDPFLKLDNTASEETNDDVIDPHSSGFIVNTVTDWTENGQSFIFYAIA